MKTKILLIAGLLGSLFSFAQNPLLLKQATNGGTATVSQVVSTTTGYTFYNTTDNTNPFSETWGLWRTNGTIEGTKKLSLSDGHFITTEATMLTPLGNNKILFAGDNDAGYGEVWVSDGTKAGTFGLQNFLTGNAPPVQAIGSIGDVGIYAAVSNDGVLRLHATQAAAYEDTSVIYTFPASLNGAAYFKTINNVLYFEINNSSTLHNEIWRTDGTAAGTYQLKDLGLDYGFASNFMAFNGSIYFITISSTYGDYIWKSDGTTAGTNKLKQISTSFNSDNLFPSYAAVEQSLITANNVLYFTANDGVHGKELWKTDGTANGTMMTFDFNPGSAGSNPNYLTAFNNEVYFSANTSIFNVGTELYKYNGSQFSQPIDIFPGPAGSNPSSLAINNNTLVFSATSNTNDGQELWVSGGDAGNTLEIENITRESGISSSPKLITSGNKNFFVASYDINRDGLTNEQCIFTYTPPTKIWTGSVNTDMSAIDNWLPSGPPSQSDDILIPFSTPNNLTQPNLLFVHDFYNNGTVNINAGACIISGNFFNAGTVNNPAVNGFYNGVFAISGTERSTHLIGSSGYFNGQLTLSGSSNARLTSNSYFPALRVEGADTIYLDDYTLKTDLFNLYRPKIITDGSGGITQIVGETPVVFDVSTDANSYTPVTITNHGTQDYFTVSVKSGVYQNGNSGDTIKQEAVNKTWLIEEQISGGSNADITLQWNAADELTGFNKNNAYLSHYTNSAWDNGNVLAVSGNNPYTITRTGITSFSPFAIASSATILPVRFVNVDASLVNKNAVIAWQVANESNVAYYNVQRSTNAQDFTTIGKLSKLSNSAILHSYTYTDFNAASMNAKNIYYRLQEVDEDGKQSLSKVVLLNLAAKNNILNIWPTPAKNVLHVAANNTQDAIAVIYNISGKQIMQQEIKAGSIAEFNVSNISSGTYFIKVYLKDGVLQGRFIKN